VRVSIRPFAPLAPIARLASVAPLGAALALAALGTTLATRAEAADPRSSRFCSSCHSDIAKQWGASSMAHSWSNPVFQSFLADAKAALGPSIQANCISCHAPLASVTGDANVEGDINKEGVTCNFCHNVTAVDVSPKAASYTWDPSDPNKMQGPFNDSDAGVTHSSTFNPLFSQGEFCASCHWYGDDKGTLTFEGTHPSWKGSKAAAAGTQCQDCHMPPGPGKTAITAKVSRDKMWPHHFLGAHTPGVLDSTATLAAVVEGGKLKLTVTNRRGGHSLPGGGASMRAITLEVAYTNAAGAELSRALVQTYDTEFADASGKSPVPKWLAKSVARSNEIPADAAKVEWAAIPAGAKSAEAILTYHFLLPAYRDALVAKKVDLTGHDPVVMARAKVALP